MINKREKSIIDMLSTRLLVDEPERDGEVTVFDFTGDEPVQEPTAEKVPAEEKKAPQKEEKKAPQKEEKKAGGTKSTVIIILVVIASLVVGFAAGYGIAAGISAIIDGQAREFVAGDMTLTLDQSFQQYKIPAYAAVYASDDIEVFVYAPVTSNVSAEEYAQSFVNYYSIKSEVEKKDGLVYFVDESEGSDGKLYNKYYFTYKNGDECWLVQFSVRDNQVWMYEKNIMKWAGSVEFN